MQVDFQISSKTRVAETSFPAVALAIHLDVIVDGACQHSIRAASTYISRMPLDPVAYARDVAERDLASDVLRTQEGVVVGLQTASRFTRPITVCPLDLYMIESALECAVCFAIGQFQSIKAEARANV